MMKNYFEKFIARYIWHCMTKSLIIGCGNLGQNIISGFYKKKKKILICDKNKILLKRDKKKL